MLIQEQLSKYNLLDNKKIDGNGNATDEGADQNMFVLGILENIKETRLKFSKTSVTVL